MDPAWLINGEPQFGIPADDRGLAYGDGLFETIAAPAGRMRRFEQHYARLKTGCERLGISAPSAAAISADVRRLVFDNHDQVIKLIVTRGSGGRGYRPQADAEPRRIVGSLPWPAYSQELYQTGARVIHCKTVLAENPAIAGLKHLCRLEQVLAQKEVAAAGADEGIMRSPGGQLVSGTMSNLFIVSNSVLKTPRVDHCGIAGVMRGAILEAAGRAGIKFTEALCPADALESADEVFLSNSLIGIWPVSEIGGVAFEVGRLTKLLMNDLQVSPQHT